KGQSIVTEQSYRVKDILDGKHDYVTMRAGDVLMITNAAPATQPAEKREYYIGGVPRSGAYSLQEPVNLLQALIAAGGNPLDVQDKMIEWTHARAAGAGISVISVKDVLNQPNESIQIGAFDQIMLTVAPATPATQPAGTAPAGRARN